MKVHSVVPQLRIYENIVLRKVEDGNFI